MTVLLAVLLFVAVATLLVILYESRKDRDKIGRSWRVGRSRRDDELALLKEWLDFEDFMKCELYGKVSEAPLHDLSGSIVDFSLMYDLDPEEIRSILRVRNSIVHGPSLISLDEVRDGLVRLRLISEKLSPVWDHDHGARSTPGWRDFASSGTR